MDGRYRRIVDLVELTGLLQTRVGGVSLDEIAERFEVSRRTAERMLGALRRRFPQLDFELREGRKYWRLPSLDDPDEVRIPEPAPRGAELSPCDRRELALVESIQQPLNELIEAARSALSGSPQEATRNMEEVARLAEDIDKLLGDRRDA